jgi:hypothetical protein
MQPQPADVIRAHQNDIINNIAKSFATPIIISGISTDDELIKSWSTELRDSNAGSRWVTMHGSHVLLGSGGEVLAAHSKLKGKMLGKKAAAFVSEARAGGSEKKPADTSSQAAPAAASGEEDKEKPQPKEAEKKPTSEADEPKEPKTPEKKEEPKEEPKAAEKPAEEAKPEEPEAKTAAEHKEAYKGALVGKGVAYQPGQGPTHEERAKKDAAMDAAASEHARNFLASDLSGEKKPKKGDEIAPKHVHGNQAPQPMGSPAFKPKNDIEGLKKIVSTDELRPSMTQVNYHADTKTLLATDGHVLMQVPHEGGSEDAAFKPDGSAGKVDSNTKNWVNVIPLEENANYGHAKGEITDIESVKSRLQGIIHANRQIGSTAGQNSQHINAEIKSGDHYAYLDPKYMHDAIEALQATGSKKITVDLSKKASQAVVFRDAENPKKLALVMPILTSEAMKNPSYTGESTEPQEDRYGKKFNPMAKTLALDVTGGTQQGGSVVAKKKQATKTAPLAADPKGDFYAGVPTSWAPGADVEYHKVAGEPVAELADKGDFVAHKQILAGGKKSTKWIVSEGKSGMRVSEPAATKEEAVKLATDKMKSYSKSQMDELVESSIAKNPKNVSPRYAS